MYLCSSYYLPCMFSVSDSSIYMIYCRSFKFSYVICYYLYLHTWITSLDHVRIYMLCTPSGFIICTRGLRLTTLDSHAQILETGPWWPCCSWSKCAADPSVMIRTQQKHRHHRSSTLSSSPDLLSRLLLLLVSTSHLLLCISLRIMYFCIFWWCNIPIILYHSLW